MVPPFSLVLALALIGLSNALDKNVCMASLSTNGKLAGAKVKTSNSDGVVAGEWCGDKQRQQSNWVEFDFGSAVGIRQMVFEKPQKGRGYVRKFSIQYVGIQGNTLQNYGNDQNKARVINALDAKYDTITIDLTGIVVRKIRINIIEFNQQPCLKLDLLGCTDPNKLCSSSCQNGGQCVFEETCACSVGYEGKQCEKAVSFSGECSTRLGMADNRIPDSSLSVSSSRLGHGKEKARHGCCTSETGGAWCPADSDTSPWYEVMFDKPQSVGGLSFLPPNQPPGVAPTEYMKTFELEYWSALESHKSWRSFAKDIPAIYNDTTYYTIKLQPAATAKAIRIIPRTSKKAPCFRFDVLGCDPKGLCPADFCKNGGLCMGENVCLCKTGFIGSQCEQTASQVITVNVGFKAIINQILQTTTTVNFEVHGNPQLVQGQTGQAVQITNSNQYLVVDNTGFGSCLKDIDKCTGGFTLTTHVNFATLTDNTYIVSSGGNLANHKGIALYYQNHQIHFVVSTSTKSWHLSSSYKLTLNVWHHLELSWQQNLGLELIDNGKVVGTVTQPVPTHATLVKQITIGHGYTQQTATHISMKVEGLKTVDANRASLAIAGILPTAPTTVKAVHTTLLPTTVKVTTTPMPTTVSTTQPTTAFVCGDKQVNFDFLEIKNNMLVTPQYNFTVYNNPIIRPESNGKAVLVLNTTGQYVELPNKGIECIQDMTKCDSGFTLSLEIKWLNMNSTDKQYIVSSGGDQVNNSGLALYLWHGDLYCSAKKDRTIWTAKEKLHVKENEWHAYQISWNKHDGFIVFLDGQIFMKHSIKLPNPAQPGTFPLLIAASPGQNDTSLMEVRNLYTWTASRDVLINHTCITEFPTVAPTTEWTTVITTTDSSSINTYVYNFIAISHNVLTTTAFNLTVHGSVHIEHHSFTATPILVLNGSNQFVEFTNKSLPKCIADLSDCQSGFTIKIDVSLIKLNHEQKTVIFSSGNQYINGTGLALYFYHGHLYGYVSTNKTWKVDVDYKVEVNKWHSYQMSWSVSHGLTLIIDGHQVASTTQTTINTFTTVQHHTLTIGKIHATTHTTFMKVTGLIMWHATHEVLIQQGLITTAAVPTNPTGIKTFNYNFIAISHNILTTSTFNLVVHGNTHLEHDNSTTSNPVLILKGSNQFVEFTNKSVPKCIAALSDCQSGFTIKIDVSLIKLNHEQKTVIFSSGNQYINGTGLALYFYHGHLYGYVSTNKTWKVDVDYKVEVNKWHTYQMSWSVLHGLTLIIDGHQVASTTQTITNTFTTVQHHTLTIGKIHATTHTALMKITGLMMWHATHQVLMQQGLLTTAAVPTNPTGIKTFNYNFIAISHNILTTSTFNLVVHGNTHLEHDNSTTSNPVLVLKGSNQFVEFTNKSVPKCIADLSDCQSGFTIKIDVSLIKLSNEQKTVIFSSGNQYINGTGLALYFYHGHLYGYVSTNKTWKVDVDYKVEVNKWHTYQMSWSVSHGLTLIIDGHQVASITQTITNTFTTVHHTLTIGKLHATSHTAFMKITGLMMWHATHEVLIQQGLLTTAAVQTTPTGIKTFNYNFIAISHNILTTSTFNLVVHGNTHLEHDNSTTSNPVLVLKGSNQFVEFTNKSLPKCIADLSDCQSGFTIKIDVSLIKLNHEQKTVIFSSGNQYINGTGLALYFYHGHLYGYVSTNKTWKVDVDYKVEVNKWHNYQMSWSVSHGLTLIIDGHQVASTTHSITNTFTTIQHHTLTIGKLHATSYTTFMKITGLLMWHATHQVLIQQGLITTAAVPTSPTGIKTFNYNFIAISHNILTTSTFNLVVNGNTHLEHDNSTTSNPVLVLKGSNQFVEFTNKSVPKCIAALSDCQSGFTIKIDVSLIKLNHEQKTVIFSSGNQYINGTGLALYFYHGHLYGYVSTNKTWKVDVDYKVEVNKWHNYQMSWSVSHGLKLIIDGHQVASTTQTTTNTFTSVQHYTLTIGKLHATSHTTFMKITGLIMWPVTHQVLIQQGLLTTASTTTTTTMATTTSVTIPKYEWTFTKIPHTTNTIVGSKFNATLHGTFKINSTGINFNNNHQYIDLGIHKNLCFGNLSLCSCGLTIKITIMFTQLEENTVIISSGAEKSEGTGLAMVYRYGQVHCMVSTATDTWFATIQREKLAFMLFHQVIISWSPVHGLKVIVNNHVISSVTKSIKHQAIVSSTEHMYIGNPPSVTSSSSCNYFMSSVIIWHCWIDNIGNGEITPPVSDTTTVPTTPHPSTTPVKTRPPTTDSCRNGYVCKDDLTTHRTWTSMKSTRPTKPKPTTKPTTPKTIKPTTQKQTTPKQTKPTTHKTTKPTKPKPTTKPTTPKQTKPTTPKTTKPTKPKPTTKPTTPKPTTPRPSRPTYIGIPHLTPGVSITGKPYFSCQFEKSKQPNVEFIVCLRIGNKCEKPVLVGGTYEEVKYTAEEINQNLFRKEITCTIQARFKGQTLVTAIKTSNKIIPDVKLVTTGTITVTEGHPVKHIIVNITTPPQMFCCKGCKGNCKITIETHSNLERFYKRCSSRKYIPEVLVGWLGTSQSPQANMCGTSVHQTIHISSWQQTVKIPVKATVDGRIDRTTHNRFTVQAHVVNQPKPPITAIPHTLNVGQVNIHAHNNDHSGQCASLNDPHITTFDGRHYDNHNGGEFVMYRHTTLPYEVRGFYTKCSSRGRVYCNCGAAIQSGDDVITFRTCGTGGNPGHGNDHGHHGHGGILGFLFGHHKRGRSPAPIAVDLYKNGELTPGTRILRIGCGQKYQVILPTGTVVTVQSSGSKFINIWVKPSSVDRGQTEGLCGSFDGNRNNDVYHQNGRPDGNKRPQWFCMKWKARQSIFYGVSAKPFNYMNTFCSCIDGKEVFCNRGHGVMYCSYSKYDITSTILRQAKIPQIHNRHRRALPDTNETPVTTAVTETDTESNATFTMEEAFDKCKDLVEESPAVKQCWKTVNVTAFNTSLENCAADLNATGDEDWASGYITNVVEECLNTLANEEEIVNGTVQQPAQQIAIDTAKLCLKDCGEHGECVEGVCRCAAGYSGLVCDVSADNTVPAIQTQSTGCGCDRNTTDDCNTIAVYGDSFVESDTLTCFYEYTQSPTYGKPSSLGRTVLGRYISINQVTCTLSEVRDGVYISISNNGQTFGNDWYLHTVYDSKCYDCSLTGTATVQYVKKEHTCIINGECLSLNEKKTDDTCKMCDPSNSVNQWTESLEKDCRCSTNVEKVKADKDDDNKQTVTILAVVIGILAFVAMVSLMYNCKMRFKKPLHRKSSMYKLSDDDYLPPPHFDNPGYADKSDMDVKM